jgi:transposase
MSPAFSKGVKENMPDAEITFDKFHIIKLINEAVDQVRREEGSYTPILKGNRYIFLKNESNLTEKQKIIKEELSMAKLNLKSVRALQIREAFQQIYVAESTEKFEGLLNNWYYWATHSQLAPIVKVAKTIKRHWDGIVSWKKSQINNGIQHATYVH